MFLMNAEIFVILLKRFNFMVILMEKISIEDPIQGQSQNACCIHSTAVVDVKSTTETKLVYTLAPKCLIFGIKKKYLIFLILTRFLEPI